MGTVLEVSFRNLPASEALEAAARRRFEQLARQFQGVASGAVTIDAPRQRRFSERPFVVHLRLRLAGAVIAIGPDTDQTGHADPYVALTAAFEAAALRLGSHYGGARRKTALIAFPSLLSSASGGSSRVH